MKYAALVAALLAASANAFAPVSKPAVSSTVAKSVWDDYIGGVDYRGKEFKFDPLNLAESYPPFVPWFREAEIRHGRTAMLAVCGFIVQDFVRIPGEAYSFESIPRTVDAHDALMTGPLLQLAMWIGLWDIVITAPAMKAVGEGEREPGDYQFGANFMPKDEAGINKKKLSELLNGRLAMCAIGGIATQSVITGHGFPYI